MSRLLPALFREFILSLIYQYKKLNFSLRLLKLLTLLEVNGFTLESLAEDLSYLVTNPQEEKLVRQILLQDYISMLEISGSEDIDQNEVEDEFSLLVKRLKELLDRQSQLKPRAVHLSYPDEVIFEYNKPRPMPSVYGIRRKQ